MNFIRLTLSLLLIFLFVSCADNPADLDPNNRITPTESDILMPLQVGNYWVYECELTDTNFVSLSPAQTFVDSLVVVSGKSIGIRTAYQIEIHRITNGIDTGAFASGYIYSDKNLIDIHGYGLNPIFFTDSMTCWSKFDSRWKFLINTNEDFWFEYAETSGDIYPSLIYENGKPKMIQTPSKWNMRYDGKTSYLGDDKYRTLIEGIRDYHLEPENDEQDVKFIKSPDYQEYFYNDDMSIHYNSFHFEFECKRGLGLTKIKAKMTDRGVPEYAYISTLVDQYIQE